ncbi:MAG: hypothetical protein ACJ762_05190 [Solirubrobacteraceae bacterium]
MTLCAATVAAKDHLAHARVVAASFRRHHPDVPFYVLLADEVQDCFEPEREPFTLIELDELEAPEPGLMRFRYPKQPLSYALTPWLIAELFTRGYERVMFIKQESLVLGSLAPEFDRLATDDILLTPHLLAPIEGPERSARERNVILAGAYNVGLLGVAARASGRAMLAWWKRRLEHHCLHAVGEGMHYEQRWSALLPAMFDSVGILRDPGLNVGHWNVEERDLLVDGDHVTALGRPCRLVRFSGYRPEDPDRVTRYDDRRAVHELGQAAELFERFRSALLGAGHEAAAEWPYAFGTFADGLPIPDLARELHLEGRDESAGLGDPFATGAGSFRSWLREPSADRPGVPRLLDAIYDRRPDVRAAYPRALEPGGLDELLGWFLNTGAGEHGIDPRLLEASP